MKLYVLTITVLFCVSASAHSAWTGKKEISALKVQGNGVYLVLKDFTNTEASIDCEGNSAFFMSESDSDNYQNKLTVLLAAFMENKQVNISYYGCAPSAANRLGLGSVSLER